MDKYWIVFCIAGIVSFSMTPLAKKLAYKVGAIDVPKDDRRVHKKPIPRMGGLAIYLGFVVSVTIGMDIDKRIMGILIGGTLIMLMGIMDDINPLSAKVKLAIQIVSALILIFYSGLKIEMINIPFVDTAMDFKKLGVPVAMISIPVTIFWIVGITNTINLIDGLDGLAAGVASIAALTLFYVSLPYAIERSNTPFLTLAVAGAALGFLPYNFNPAKIFMGDTGSLFLGYMLAAISVEGFVKSATAATAIATIVPVLALGLPIFDTTFAILRRALNGKPIMEPDKGHLHHRLLSTGMGQKRTVLTLYGISTIFGISAALISNNKSWEFLFVVGVTSILMYVGMNFQRFEKRRSGHKE